MNGRRVKGTGTIQHQRDAGLYAASYVSEVLRVDRQRVISLIEAGAIPSVEVQQGKKTVRRVRAGDLESIARRMGVDWSHGAAQAAKPVITEH